MLTSGELTTFLMYTLYAGFSFAGMSAFYGDLMKAAGASSRIVELLDRQPHVRSVKDWQPLPQPVQGRIGFHDVRFWYPRRADVTVFDGLNLEIKPNETLALVGPSGSGKSSVIGLLARFYELDASGCSEKITVDEVDIVTLHPSQLRCLIGAVSSTLTDA